MLSISDAANQMIVAFEIGNINEYDATELHPTWPGGASGVTIGVGADLGYMDEAQLRADWAALPDADLDRLANVVGFKGYTAKQALPKVADVIIPYLDAMDVFQNTDIPRTIALVDSTFANCAELSPDSFGALVSLVFNRGSDCSDTPTRFEMYEIQLDMLSRDFVAIPGWITKMKRLWQNLPGLEGLLTRRDAEAALFQSGLGVPAAPVVQVLAVGSSGPAVMLLQDALKIAGQYVGYTIDGQYGAHTRDAVAAYQAAHGLYVDGIAGAKTLASLKLSG